MTDRTVATVEPEGAHTLEQVVIVGDLARLSPSERVMYYHETCRSLGLNPLTKPFQYIVLNGKLTLYPTKTATDQLRALRGISIDRIEQEEVAETYTVTVYGHDATGRIDSDMGVVSIANLKGENRANAIMKAITKAKRRLTLSLSGLGWPDETEVFTVPSAEAVDVDLETGEIRREQTITERIAARRASITEGPAVTGAPQPEADPSPPPALAAALDAPAIEGMPTAAPDEESPQTAPSEAAAGRSATLPAPSRCEGFSAELGPCRRQAGHLGNHANKDKETWA